MAIGAFVALVGFSRSFEHEWQRLYSSSGTDIAVVDKNFLNSSINQSLQAKLRAVPDVAMAEPIIFNILDITPEVNAIMFGWLDDSYEFNSLTFSSGGRFHNGKPEVILGELLAKNLDKKVGETIELQGSPYSGFHVRLRPAPAGESPDHYFKRAQHEIEAALPGLNAQSAADRASNNQFVTLAHAVAWGTSCIALMMGILGIANTMAMSVFERTREIGILRAIGWKTWRVLLLIQVEATVLGFAGGILGIGFGWGALHLLSAFPQTASIVSTSLSWVHLVESLAISILSGLIAGAYPAWRGAHLSPVEALRHD
jgi:putative ABC transport system permease protein